LPRRGSPCSLCVNPTCFWLLEKRVVGGPGARATEGDADPFADLIPDQLAKACAVWPRGHDKAELHHLAAWDGPVLALVGELDPVTPPVYGQRIIAQFPNGRLVRLPNQMHDMTDQAFTTCAQPLIVAFIKSARASDLDTRCTEGLAFPEFVLTPDRR